MDIWGRIADQINSGTLTLAAHSGELEFARRSLVANVLKSWLTWVNARQLLLNEQARLENLDFTTGIVTDRYASGLGKIEELDTARADLEQARASVALQTQRVFDAHLTLKQWLGNMQPISDLPQSWPQIAFPQVQLPGSALGHRPDLQAAYQRIQAADVQSQVAYKNLLPKFTINLDLSTVGQNPGDWFSGDPVWSLLGQLTQPVFNGGALKHEVEKAQLRAEQAYWSYRESLLAAFIEVESSLANEQALQKQYSALSKAHQHALASEQYVQQRYRRGLENIQSLLIAKRTTFDTNAQLLQATLSRATNRIDLGLALGLPIQQGT
jgi:outer membrane protein TolC